MEYYKLSIECNTREIAKVIQQWVNRNFNDDEIYWNAITKVEIKDKEEKK